MGKIIKFKANPRTELYLEYMEATKPKNNIKESEDEYKVRRFCCHRYAHMYYESNGSLEEGWLEAFVNYTAESINRTIREIIEAGAVDKYCAYVMEKLHE